MYSLIKSPCFWCVLSDQCICLLLTQSRCAKIGGSDSPSVSMCDTVSSKAARCEDALSFEIMPITPR